MAFRAVKADTYAAIRSRATQLKKLAADSRVLMAGTVSANVIRQLLDTFIAGKAELTAASQVPGMADYAKAQEGDPLYNVATEFTAMIDACTGVINWIVTNIPKDNNAPNYVILEQWSASGVTVRTFTTGDTAGLRTVLQTFEGTVS